MFNQTFYPSVAGALLLLASSAQSAGLLTPAGSERALQIVDHEVNVIIEDGFATTDITQVFRNTQTAAKEAIYQFPLPQDAVVGSFSYWINGQEVIAEAVEKAQAEQIYTEQKNQGQATALTQSEDDHQFSMRVSPIIAGADVRIRLTYMENALLDHGVGSYVYPLQNSDADAAAQSFWQRDETVYGNFQFDVTMRSAYPIDALRLPNLAQAQISQQESGVWSAHYHYNASTEGAQAYALDEDINVYWRHVQGLPGRLDLLAQRDASAGKAGTFKLTLTPGDDLPDLTGKRDWTFVLDRSGSISNDFSSLVAGIEGALQKLPTGDRFRVMTFSEQVYDISGGFVAVTPDNAQRVLQAVKAAGVGGGTNLYAGVEAGLADLDADRANAVILVTDGIANLGVTEKAHFLDLLRQVDVRLFTYILGNGANEALLKPMTAVSDGYAVNVSNSADMIAHLMNAQSRLSHFALRNIHVQIEGVTVEDLAPKYINSLYRGQQLELFGHYADGGTANVTITGEAGGVRRTYQTTVDLPRHQVAYPELERLWAVAAIADLKQGMDYLEQEDGDSKQSIIDIALEYGLLTDYTSLLVVDEGQFEALGLARTNQERVQRERQAQAARQAQAPMPTRADASQPVSHQGSASHSGGGGGASGYVFMVLLLLMLGAQCLLKKYRQ